MEHRVQIWTGPKGKVPDHDDVFEGELGVWGDLPVIRFTTPHARGATSFEVHLHTSNFELLAKLMLQANSIAAIRAFGRAMSELPDQPSTE
jgi:hypothetical protein